MIQTWMCVAAAENAIVGDRRRDARSHHERGARRHAVNDEHMALAARDQHHAHHHGHLETTKGGENLDRVGDVSMASLSTLKHPEFSRQVVLRHQWP